MIIAAALILMAGQAFGQAKYVFYFIGDGMGVNQVNLTEMFMAASQGEWGCGQLCFTGFPVASVATTWSFNSEVTDSAASGTALSTGHKTNNGNIGVDSENNPLVTMAEIAKQKGKKVGIVTTVGANHATPAAFFGHQANRNMYDELLLDMAAADFDFYAGSDLLKNKKDNRRFEDGKKILEDAGYTFAGSVDEYKAKSADAKKMVMVPDGGNYICYAIDRHNAQDKSKIISLKDLVESSLDFLTKDKKSKGFFLMAEGGKIDGSCHGNDAATAIQEIIDFDEAIQVAYNFYLKHPKETSIIVTADHETGGFVLGPKKPEHLAILANQKVSEGTLTTLLKEQMKAKGKTPMTWEEVKAFFAENLGLWDSIEVSPENELNLFQIYIATIAKRESGNVSDEYGYNHDASIVSAAVDLFDSLAGARFTTGGHSAGYTPVYAIGVGQEKFLEKTDNAKIGQKIIEIINKAK